MDAFTNTYHVNVTGAFYTILAFLSLLDEGNKRRRKVEEVVEGGMAKSVCSPYLPLSHTRISSSTYTLRVY